MFYSTQLFDKLSGNGGMMTLIIGGANILGGVLGMFTMPSWGRKGNILYGVVI